MSHSRKRPTTKPGTFARGLALVGLLTGSALHAGACGGDPDLSDPEEAGEAVGEAYCGFLAGCCGASSLPGGSESACAQQITQNFGLFIEQAEREGYVYDARCVEATLTLLESAECDLSGGLSPRTGAACVPTCQGGFVRGTTQKGQACEDPRECDFGLICVGVCVEACGVAPGGRCGVENEVYLPCRADAYCEPDLGDSTRGTCVALPKRGEACPNFQCAAGFACIDGTCGSPQPNGAPCRLLTDCTSGFCDPTDPQNPVCASLPGVGQPCPYFQCTPDATCDGSVCVALPGLGQPCPDFQCAAGLICDGETCKSEQQLLCGALSGSPD